MVICGSVLLISKKYQIEPMCDIVIIRSLNTAGNIRRCGIVPEKMPDRCFCLSEVMSKNASITAECNLFADKIAAVLFTDDQFVSTVDQKSEA